ncbi:ABC transporter ATP-binding protein [Brassicibacter mesophilus]|uniref:ABC transporter ATP-binding protein n=1 Tax=Brassicibacter mesophilus TaxID=745119 RepID=UPI003D1B2558
MIRYFIKNKNLLIINLILTTAHSILVTSLAFLIRELIDLGIDKNFDRLINLQFFAFFYIIVMVLVCLLRKLCWAKLIKLALTSLKNDIFKKLISRDKRVFSNQNTANYLSIITNDVEMLERGYFSNSLVLIQVVVSFIIAVIGIIKLNGYVALIVLVLSLIPAIVPYIFGNKLALFKKDHSDYLSKFTEKSKDFLMGFDIIKSYNLRDKVFSEYKKTNDNVGISKFKFSVYNAKVDLIVEGFSFLSFFILLSIGAYLVAINKSTVGTFVAAVQLMEFIKAPMQSICHIVGNFKSVSLICKKLESILNEDSLEEQGEIKEDFVNSIEFRNVSYSYDHEIRVLKDLNFRFNKGKKYAIIGKSGSGKSTILKLLMKYYFDYDGNIFIDNISNKTISSISLNKMISVTHQDVFLFDTTIKNNITLFEDYSCTEIKNALIDSGLYDFVNQLDNRENTLIGENGCNLSGGEKQRISIARAIIRNTPILVLDEATSSLDNKTSDFIENTILNLKDKTIIVITHKLSKKLLKEFDEIIVLKEGQVIESGDFNYLIGKQGYFYSLYMIEDNSDLCSFAL